MTKSGVIAAIVGLVGGVGVAALVLTGSLPMPSWLTSNSTGTALVGGPFELVDHTGAEVTERDFHGKYMLVYFGFAHCPDICPSALQVMSAALDQVGASADKIVPIFISVDPERDTPELMAAYVSAFHPRLRGLTGSTEAVASAAKAYRVFYRKVADPGSTSDYTIDHSSIIYLMGPDGRFVTHFTHGTSLDVVTQRLKSLP
ncbi:MAG: SCO family protein [Pseudomonadota bacterium]